MKNVNEIARFDDADAGLAAVITRGAKGFHVTLIDTDVNQSVGGRIYPFTLADAEAKAIDYAKKLVAF